MQREYRPYLIIDWRRDRMRLRQSLPKLAPYEVAIKLSLTVNVPKTEIISVDGGSIDVPQAIAEAGQAKHILPHIDIDTEE